MTLEGPAFVDYNTIDGKGVGEVFAIFAVYGLEEGEYRCW